MVNNRLVIDSQMGGVTDLRVELEYDVDIIRAWIHYFTVGVSFNDDSVGNIFMAKYYQCNEIKCTNLIVIKYMH